MSKVIVTRIVLDWALSRSGHNIETLKDKFPKIRQWIGGTELPTLRQLEKFAKATRTPIGFFFLETPPLETLPVPHFRTLSDREPGSPSPELIDSLRAMQARQLWMRDYLVEEGVDSLSFVDSCDRRQTPTRVAEKIRETLELKADWACDYVNWEYALRGLIDAIDNSGILVVINGVVGNNTHRALSVEEFRGFVLVDKFAPLIFVNGKDSKAAQMFTLGHELAHVLIGKSAAFDLRQLQPASDPSEKFCNEVAAEFLVPSTSLIEYWPQVVGAEEPFRAVAIRFKVSTLVAARRAMDLNLIDREEFFAFYAEYLDYLRGRGQASPGGDFYLNQNFRVGKRFGKTVARATHEGRLLYTDAYRLTDLYGASFENYVNELSTGGDY